MQDTPVPTFFADLTAQERAALFTDERLRTLPAAFATVPDPRKRRGQRYDLPFLLLCLVAALLCDCNSLEAVGRWTRDQRTVLARVCGPRRHLCPTGSLYRRLLPRLSFRPTDCVKTLSEPFDGAQGERISTQFPMRPHRLW